MLTEYNIMYKELWYIQGEIRCHSAKISNEWEDENYKRNTDGRHVLVVVLVCFVLFSFCFFSLRVLHPVPK